MFHEFRHFDAEFTRPLSILSLSLSLTIFRGTTVHSRLESPPNHGGGDDDETRGRNHPRRDVTRDDVDEVYHGAR